MIQLANIHSERLNDAKRLTVTADLFGVHFPFKLEPCVYTLADRLAPAPPRLRATPPDTGQSPPPAPVRLVISISPALLSLS